MVTGHECHEKKNIIFLKTTTAATTFICTPKERNTDGNNYKLKII